MMQNHFFSMFLPSMMSMAAGKYTCDTSEHIQAQFREFFENPDKLSMEKTNLLKLCGIKKDEK